MSEYDPSKFTELSRLTPQQRAKRISWLRENPDSPLMSTTGDGAVRKRVLDELTQLMLEEMPEVFDDVAPEVGVTSDNSALDDAIARAHPELTPQIVDGIYIQLETSDGRPVHKLSYMGAKEAEQTILGDRNHAYWANNDSEEAGRARLTLMGIQRRLNELESAAPPPLTAQEQADELMPSWLRSPRPEAEGEVSPEGGTPPRPIKNGQPDPHL